MFRRIIPAVVVGIFSTAASAAPLLPAGIPGLTASPPALPVIGTLPSLTQLPGLSVLTADLSSGQLPSLPVIGLVPVLLETGVLGLPGLPELPTLPGLPGLPTGSSQPALPSLALPDLTTLTAPFTTDPQFAALATELLATGTGALTSVVAPINSQIPIPVVGDIFGGTGN